MMFVALAELLIDLCRAEKVRDFFQRKNKIKFRFHVLKVAHPGGVSNQFDKNLSAMEEDKLPPCPNLRRLIQVEAHLLRLPIVRQGAEDGRSLAGIQTSCQPAVSGSDDLSVRHKESGRKSPERVSLPALARNA